MFLNLENIVPLTAVLTSAELKTIKGAFPPSSRDTFFTESAHCRISSFPTAVEPVNERAATSSLLVSASPTVGVAWRLAVTTLNIPGGTPACCVSYCSGVHMKCKKYAYKWMVLLYISTCRCMCCTCAHCMVV